MTTRDRRRGRRILWALAGVFVALVVAGVALASRFGDDPALIDSPLIGVAAPRLELPYLEGEGTLALADLRGDIVVVNFWASWCIPCREEHAGLVATAAAYEDLGVRFVGISYQDRPADAAAFLDDLGRGYTYLRDEGSRGALEFGVFGVPETFFIDRDGIVVGKIAGAADPGFLSRTLDAIILGDPVDSVEMGPVQPAPG